MNRRLAHELLHAVDRGRTQVFRAFVGGFLQSALDPIKSEFLALALAFQQSPGNQQKRGAGRQRDQGRIASGVRKKSQRQAGGAQFTDAGRVTKQARGMAGVEIADGAQIFVVAGGEGRAGADATLGRHDSAVEFQAELGHSVGLIHVVGSE